MKKSLLALAVLGAFAGAASAQSSVTLFGGIDLSARAVKNGDAGTLKTLSQDGIYSSRFGVRGVEDLGGGLKAGFHLEAGVNPDTGTANGKFWNRRSTVSLMGNFGELRLGRDYTPTFRGHANYDPFGTNGVGNSLNLFTGGALSAAETAAGLGTPAASGAATLVRADNSIAYWLPAMGGVYGEVMVAAGERVPGNKYIGGRIGYGAGPLDVALSYGRTEVDASGDAKLKQINLGASYDLGMVKPMFFYTRYNTDQFAGLAADAKQTIWMIGATAPVGAGEFRASYGRTKIDGTAGGADLGSDIGASQIALGYVHNLSKRTALYGTFARVNNKPAGQFAISGGNATDMADKNSTGYELGVRHIF